MSGKIGDILTWPFKNPFKEKKEPKYVEPTTIQKPKKKEDIQKDEKKKILSGITNPFIRTSSQGITTSANTAQAGLKRTYGE